LRPIPDDEILGPGATLRKHVLAGDEVYCLILGQGITSRMQKYTHDDILSISQFDYSQELCDLQRNAKAAAGIIGFKHIELLSNPDNAFDTVSLLSIVKSIEFYLDLWKPEIIYTHFGQDLNVDHRLTFQAVMVACRPGCSIVKEIYCFEISSSTDYANNTGLQPFIPDKFVDIKETLQCKINAMKCYQTELRDWPHPRSLEGIKILAQYRGMTVNKEYCEAFETIRKVG
jgi:LmbE family N-acetylglucosaminyl deacetylase